MLRHSKSQGVAFSLALASVLWIGRARAEQVEATASAEGGAPDRAELVAATVNLAGFGFFGPSIAAEIGGRATGYVTLRPFALGLLSHSLFVDDDATKLKLSSVGAGLGARYYLSEDARFQGLYVGASGEALFISFENTAERYDLSRRIAVLLLEGGYRHRFGKVLLGGGARAGYAFELSNECTASAGSAFACAAEEWGSNLYGELALDLGWVF